MKKKNLSFMTLFMLTASLIGGCSCNKQSNENVSNLVLKVKDKEYSAKDLYNELLSSGTGANEAFAKVLRLVVESSMETTKNIQSAADLAVENFEEDVETDSLTNGTSKEESREKLLKEKGYASIDEMKSDIIYKEKLVRITDAYWEENKGNYFNDYMEARLPYLIRHVLVKIDDSNANKIANNVAISQDDGKKLFDVIKRFESGDKFSYVANQESEDTGSTAKGGAYYMDNTSGVNGFVDEFVYGTYAFDAYTTKNVEDGEVVSYSYGANATKLAKLTGLTDTETFSKYYQDGFNFVDMSYVNMMGEVYNKRTQSDRDYFDINAYNKVEKEGEDPTYESATGNLNSEENAYASNILFNRVFNKPGVSVIGYNTKKEAEDAGAKNFVELKMSATESKYVLTDEKGNIIFFVAARGSSNALWVHFLTINVSSLDNFEEAKKFFGLTYDETDDDATYIELMNTAGTSTGANTIVQELESYIKSYVTYGNGSAIGEESILNLDMVQYYMKKNNITFESTELENAINAYITNKKTLLETKLLNSMVDDWDSHTNKLAMNMNELVQKGVKPFECAVLLPRDIEAEKNPYTILSYNTDSLCRYVYGEGYEVQLFYAYKTGESSSDYTRISTTTSNNAYFDSTTPYKQWVKIGEGSSHIVLPEPKTASGYVFEGWYTDKALTQEVAKDNDGDYYIDLSTTSMDNNTIFFAKITAIDTTTISYKYEYADGTEVSSELAELLNAENNNVKSQKFVEGGNNTISITAFTSEYVTVTGFDQDTITLTAADSAQTKEVVVTVAPKATNIEYIYVDENGNGVEAPASDSVPNPSTITYGTGNNEITLVTTGYKTAVNEGEGEDYLVSGFKVTRGHVESGDVEEEFNDIEETTTSITLEETDAGHVITVFVIVAGGNA